MAGSGEATDSLWTEAIISGIPPTVTEDHLINFLECKNPNCHVEQVKFKKNGMAVVTFEKPVDKKVLQTLCEQESILGKHLVIRPVDRRGAVLILNPSPKTTTSSFKYYLSNRKRSGGAPVVDIHREDNFVIAYFPLTEDAERVAGKQHILENQELKLVLFDPNFEEPPVAESQPQKSRSSVPPAASAMSSDQPGPHISQSYGSCSFACNTVGNTGQSHTGFTHSANLNNQGSINGNPGSLGNTGHTGVHFSQSGEMHDYNSNNCNPGSFGSMDRSGHTSFIGDAQKNVSDPGAVENKSGDVAEKMETEAMQEKMEEQCTKTVEGLCLLYMRLLDVFCGSISKGQLDVQMKVDDDVVNIQGELHEVERAETLVLSLLDEQNTSPFITEPVAQFEGWDDVFDIIEYDVKKKGCHLAVAEADFSKKSFCIRMVHACQSWSFDEFFKHYVSWETLPVISKDAEELLETTAWESFRENDMGCGNKVLVFHEKKDHNIWVIGMRTYLDEALKSVKQFLNNVPDEQHLDLLPIENEFVQKFWLNGGSYHQTGSGVDYAEINLDRSHLVIKGYRAKVRHELKEYEKLHQEMKCKHVILTHPKLGRFQNNRELWDDTVRAVVSETQCLIKDLPDTTVRYEDDDHKDWGQWGAAVVSSLTIPGQGLVVQVVQGHTDDLKVDAAVLTASSYSYSGSSPGSALWMEAHQGGVHVAPSNGRPCKAVILVNVQHYLPSQGPQDFRSWQNALSCLATDLFDLCERHRFRNLAVPVFGVDVGGEIVQPIHDMTSILAECITQQCSRRQRSGGPHVQNVFVCSHRAACLQGMLFSLQNNHPWTSGHPSPYSLTMLATVVPKSEGRALDPSAIEIIRGDIARTQVEALVVPLDIDIDLDLNKTAITKSLRQGGYEVETSLQSSGHWSVWPSKDIESRNEELADQRILVGKGGSLYARDIFYVHLPPWGPDAARMLKECVEKGLEKATERKCRNVALTALGVGKLDYPPSCAARITLAAVSGFLEVKQTSVTHVKIVIYDHQTFSVYKEEHNKWMHSLYSNPRGVPASLPLLQYPFHTIPGASSAGSSVDGGAGRGGHHTDHRRDMATVKGVKLRVKSGNILYEKSDVIVSSTNSVFELNGGVARALNQQCAYFEKFCHQRDNRKTMKKEGVVITQAVGLSGPTHILHLDMERYNKKPKEFLLKCLTTMISQLPHARIVAFPALATGAWKNNDPGLVVRSLREALGELKKKQALEEVRVLVSKKDLFNKLVAELHPHGNHRSASPHSPSTSYSKQKAIHPSSAPATVTSSASGASAPPSSPGVLASRVPRASYTNGTALTLFIFSHDPESRLKASLQLAKKLTDILGPLEIEHPQAKDGAAAQGYQDSGNTRDPGCMAAAFAGWGWK